MRLANPIIDKMSATEFDEFQDRLYNIMRALYERNDLADLLPIPPPPRPDYVSRNKEVAKPRSYAPPIPGEDEWPKQDWDYEPEEANQSGFCQADDASQQSAPFPATQERLPEGSAPRGSEQEHRPETQSSAEPLATASLPTIPIITSAVAL
jgi:hypothetical protein